jgi:hypothetical protein
MAYPVALILAVEQSVTADDVLPDGALDPEEPNVLTVLGARFFYRRVPGLHTAGSYTWRLFILQPDGDVLRATAKALKNKVEEADPTEVRVFTPAAFAALAPAPVLDAVKEAWFSIWRAESSPEGIAMQQSYGDADLDREEDPEP